MPLRASIVGLARRIGALTRCGSASARSPGRRDPLGPAGERAAAKFLRRAGYRVVAANLRLAPGEIDLLALDPSRRTLVVVEVKTRRLEASVAGETSRGAAPPPEASVTGEKRRKLLALATVVSSRPKWRGYGVRIDVIGVDWGASDKPLIRHHVNAVVR